MAFSLRGRRKEGGGGREEGKTGGREKRKAKVEGIKGGFKRANGRED